MENGKKKGVGGGVRVVMVKEKGANQDHRTRDAQGHQVREPVMVKICPIERSRKLKSKGFSCIRQYFLNFQVHSNHLGVLLNGRF